MRKSRRRFLTSSLTALGAAASSAASPASAGEAASRNVSGDAPFRLIFETEWNDMPCADYPLTRERWVEECIHPLAERKSIRSFITCVPAMVMWPG